MEIIAQNKYAIVIENKRDYEIYLKTNAGLKFHEAYHWDGWMTMANGKKVFIEYDEPYNAKNDALYELEEIKKREVLKEKTAKQSDRHEANFGKIIAGDKIEETPVFDKTISFLDKIIAGEDISETHSKIPDKEDKTKNDDIEH